MLAEFPSEIEFQLLEKFKLLQPPPQQITTSPPLPDLEELTAHLLNWCTSGDLNNTFCYQNQTTPSITGILTSPALASVLIHHIDPTTVATLQTFLHATTLQHTGWHDLRPPPQRLTSADLQLIGHATGSSLLREHLPPLLAPSPDDALGGSSSPKASRATLQAKLCVVLGTILGVIYATFPHNTLAVWPQQSPQPPSPPQQPTSSFDPPSDIRTRGVSVLLPASGPFQNSPTQWLAAKERLRLVLASELIRLARPLGFVSDAETERAIVDSLMTRRRWDGGQWVWGNVLAPPPPAPPPVVMDPFSPLGEGWDNRGQHDKDSMFCHMNGPVGTFHPTPQAVMVGSPEVLSPHFPRPDSSDGRKRRSMILVGPSDDRQMYARVRFAGGSGRIGMMA